MKEREVKKYMLDVCKFHKIEYRKVAWENRKDAPDWLLFMGGGVFVELKATGKEPTKAQYREHAKMRAGGMEVYVADCRGAIDEIFSEHGFLHTLRCL